MPPSGSMHENDELALDNQSCPAIGEEAVDYRMGNNEQRKRMHARLDAGHDPLGCNPPVAP
eukprot:3309935-Amphidinium_carterae.5